MVCQFYLSFQRTRFWLCWFLLWSLFAEVQPLQDPGELSGEMAWANEWMREERIEADIPWFTQKANKAPRQGTCSVHVSCKYSPSLRREWRCRAPSHSGLRSPGRKLNTESHCAPRVQPGKENKRKKERKTHGDQASVCEALTFIIKRNFYTLTCT